MVSERLDVPRTHAVHGQVAALAFAELRVSAALTDGAMWYPVHVAPSVLRFELEHGVEPRRWDYNERSIAKVREHEQLVLGEHAGFFDLFVPVRDARAVCSVLVVGPFLLARPTASDILVRWRSALGGSTRASDPEFLHYVSTTLATPAFEGDRLSLFKRLASRFATLLEGGGDALRLSEEISELRRRLGEMRLLERMAEQVRDMVDERTTRGATGPPNLPGLKLLNMDRVPEHVIVGLLVGSHDVDPIEGLVRRDAFQRSAAELCSKRKGALCGRVGDYGIAVLCYGGTTSPRARAKLDEWAEHLRTLARRHRFQLRIGICSADVGSDLPARYQAALAAAEESISSGRFSVHARPYQRPIRQSLRELRSHLGRVVRENPKLIRSSFDRYLDAVGAHCGYRIESIRAHLEGGFDLVTDALRATGGLDERSLVAWELALERAAGKATTVAELTVAYREIMAEIEAALLQPTEARRERTLRRALAHIRDHLAEPLRLADVARVAGLSRTYFSTLFAKRQRVTFQEHVCTLRVERAKRMLGSTTLSVERVAQLCGFGSRAQFYVAFGRLVGATPAEFRSHAAGGKRRRGSTRSTFMPRVDPRVGSGRNPQQ